MIYKFIRVKANSMKEAKEKFLHNEGILKTSKKISGYLNKYGVRTTAKEQAEEMLKNAKGFKYQDGEYEFGWFKP